MIPVATWDERADLEASVREFGYLAPIIAWRNERGEVVILDGHARWQLWRAAVANPDATVGLAAREPSVVELALPDRDAARLWIINAQLGRRNLASVDRIMLVSKRQEIVKRLAKANQSAAGGDKKSWAFKTLFKSGSPALAKVIAPIDSREVAALEAHVSNGTYSAGKQIIDAVAQGELPPTIVEDIRKGTKSIHGVAASLKPKADAKPARKAKSGWQTLVSGFSKAIRRIVRRDPARSAEIAVELRRLADEFEQQASVAA